MRRAEAGDARAIARVHVNTWRQTYRGIVPDAVLDALSVDEREAMWRRAARPRPAGGLFVAETESGVVGFAVSGLEERGRSDFPGEVYALYVLPANQGQGLGTRLFRAAVRSLSEAGLDAVLVWVLKANPYRRFYEKLGGELVDEGSVELGGVRLPTVAYGWRELAAWLEVRR